MSKKTINELHLDETPLVPSVAKVLGLGATEDESPNGVISEVQQLDTGNVGDVLTTQADGSAAMSPLPLNPTFTHTISSDDSRDQADVVIDRNVGNSSLNLDGYNAESFGTAPASGQDTRITQHLDVNGLDVDVHVDTENPRGKSIRVNNVSGSDTRTLENGDAASPYDWDRPWASFTAAYASAASGDSIVVEGNFTGVTFDMNRNVDLELDLSRVSDTGSILQQPPAGSSPSIKVTGRPRVTQTGLACVAVQGGQFDYDIGDLFPNSGASSGIGLYIGSARSPVEGNISHGSIKDSGAFGHRIVPADLSGSINLESRGLVLARRPVNMVNVSSTDWGFPVTATYNGLDSVNSTNTDSYFIYIEDGGSGGAMRVSLTNKGDALATMGGITAIGSNVKVDFTNTGTISGSTSNNTALVFTYGVISANAGATLIYDAPEVIARDEGVNQSRGVVSAITGGTVIQKSNTRLRQEGQTQALLVDKPSIFWTESGANNIILEGHATGYHDSLTNGVLFNNRSGSGDVWIMDGVTTNLDAPNTFGGVASGAVSVNNGIINSNANLFTQNY